MQIPTLRDILFALAVLAVLIALALLIQLGQPFRVW